MSTVYLNRECGACYWFKIDATNIESLEEAKDIRDEIKSWVDDLSPVVELDDYSLPEPDDEDGKTDFAKSTPKGRQDVAQQCVDGTSHYVTYSVSCEWESEVEFDEDGIDVGSSGDTVDGIMEYIREKLEDNDYRVTGCEVVEDYSESIDELAQRVPEAFREWEEDALWAEADRQCDKWRERQAFDYEDR